MVAMSGGVDSSVAAALLAEGEAEVVGVTLKLWGGEADAGCCSVADVDDARRVADQLGIEHHVFNFGRDFDREVVGPYVEAHRDGRTPNPCIECNRRVRFGSLYERMDALDCDVLVTGHHARVAGPAGRRRLLRGRDRAKDQSYVLHMLSASQLDRIALPIGELTKDQVRVRAGELGLRTAAKPDSQDLCFVDGDYRDFLGARFPAATRPGPIVDVAGTRVGEHRGTAGFTVGQRRGLGLAGPEPRYVLAVRPDTATIVVGPRQDLLADGCRLEDVSWVGGSAPADPVVEVQIRYRSPAVPARLIVSGSGWEVWFDRPQEAVAPGQAGVLYRGDEVLGGGTIAAALTGVGV
jgi:tRNA-specific 2-thiouridylase